MIVAARAVMEALRRMATGTPEEQADVRLQIEEENAAMEKDMKEATAKTFGKKGPPSPAEIEKLTGKKKKAYDKSYKKMQTLALKKYNARQTKLKKERAKKFKSFK